jgi:hypothetical protein
MMRPQRAHAERRHPGALLRVRRETIGISALSTCSLKPHRVPSRSVAGEVRTSLSAPGDAATPAVVLHRHGAETCAAAVPSEQFSLDLPQGQQQ